MRFTTAGVLKRVREAGLNLSSGCIRLLNSDVEHLYERVKLGSKVVVIGPGESSANVLRESTNPFSALFGES